MRRIILVACLALSSFAIAAGASIAERYAMIVGNSAYQGAASLSNPGNDARAMAEALDGLGFETTLLLDATGAETVARHRAIGREGVEDG